MGRRCRVTEADPGHVAISEHTTHIGISFEFVDPMLKFRASLMHPNCAPHHDVGQIRVNNCREQATESHLTFDAAILNPV
jgi:hypothetical protein